jgi:hypothetical protein
MDKTEALSKIAENFPALFATLGAILLIVGAASPLKVGEWELSTTGSSKWLLLLVGVVLCLVGAILAWRQHFSDGKRGILKDYGFKIDEPSFGNRVVSPVIIRGSFKFRPPDGMARIIEFIPTTGSYFPKAPLQIDPKTNRWSCKTQFGGQPGEQREFVVALCGPDSDIMFGYHQKVGKEAQRWIGLDKLPSDTVLKTRVVVEIGDLRAN